MDQNNIKPEKITKPIQLLAVWLIGLILLVSALITGAATISTPVWIPAFFSISAVCIIPLFLTLIFLLQTKFRPQMQEDIYYSEYLNNNTLEKENSVTENSIELLTQKIDNKLIELTTITKESIIEINHTLDEITANNKRPIKSYEKQFENFIDDNKNVIYLNLKLPNFNEIVNKLSEINIKIDHFFGDRSHLHAPTTFLLSFGSEVSLETIKNIVDTLTEFGLTDLQVIRQGLSNKDHIYIGSYAYLNSENKQNPTATITPELLKNLNNSKNIQQYYSIVKQNMKL